jgi:hypothetical protein
MNAEVSVTAAQAPRLRRRRRWRKGLDEVKDFLYILGSKMLNLGDYFLKQLGHDENPLYPKATPGGVGGTTADAMHRVPTRNSVRRSAADSIVEPEVRHRGLTALDLISTMGPWHVSSHT